MRIIVLIAILGVVPHPAHAGWCAMERSNLERTILQDKAEGLYVQDRTYARMREKIEEGCRPGGFYDRLDRATDQMRAVCKDHPDTSGC